MNFSQVRLRAVSLSTQKQASDQVQKLPVVSKRDVCQPDTCHISICYEILCLLTLMFVFLGYFLSGKREWL